MPEIGEIARSIDLGYRKSSGSHKRIWCACEECGKERWVTLRKGSPIYRICHRCSVSRVGEARRGPNNPNWTGGRLKASDGYIEVHVGLDSFFRPMARLRGASGYVREHRLVMAQHLGRCLHTWETVHHLNGDRTDNRIENLALTMEQYHDKHTLAKRMQERIRQLETRVTLLEAESTLKR